MEAHFGSRATDHADQQPCTANMSPGLPSFKIAAAAAAADDDDDDDDRHHHDDKEEEEEED